MSKLGRYSSATNGHSSSKRSLIIEAQLAGSRNKVCTPMLYSRLYRQFVSYLPKVLPIGFAITLAACGSINVQPQIEAFAEATRSAARAVQVVADAPGVEAQADAIHGRSWANAGWTIDVHGCDDPVSLLDARSAEQVEKKGAGTPDFDDACRLKPLNARGETPVIDPDVDLDPAVRALNAKTVAIALEAYAEALGALAASETPEKAGEALSRAITAARKLGDIAVEANGGEISTNRANLLTFGGTLLTELGREAFQAYRFAQLRSAVRFANSAVEDAATFLAKWQYELEKAELRPRYGALTEKIDTYNRSVTAADSRRANAALLAAEVLADRRTLRAAEDATKWRAFTSIISAHASVLSALERPRDVDQLVAANSRIIELIGTVDGFVKAVEENQARTKPNQGGN